MTAGVTVELPVHGRPVLLAGASARAISTAAALVDAGAVLSIACPSPAPYFDDLAERGLLTLHRREPTAAPRQSCSRTPAAGKATATLHDGQNNSTGSASAPNRPPRPPPAVRGAAGSSSSAVAPATRAC